MPSSHTYTCLPDFSPNFSTDYADERPPLTRAAAAADAAAADAGVDLVPRALAGHEHTFQVRLVVSPPFVSFILISILFFSFLISVCIIGPFMSTGASR
jgi:hypothetical protein